MKKVSNDNVAPVARACHGRVPTWQVARVSSIDSTQEELRRRIKNLPKGLQLTPSVLQAAEQRQGRGQRAPDWRSPKGGAYQSFAIEDTAGKLYTSYLPLAIAVGLAQVFASDGLQLMIKWSNDLLYKNRKLAGILCERIQQADNKYLLIGVGMNVNNPIPEGAIGLGGWQLEHVYQQIIAGVSKGLQLCAEKQDIVAAFAPFDSFRDKRIQLEQANKVLTGVARGIDAQGCLQLESETGTQHSICWTDPARGRVRLLPQR